MTLAQKVKTYQLKGTFQHSVDFFFLIYKVLGSKTLTCCYVFVYLLLTIYFSQRETDE